MLKMLKRRRKKRKEWSGKEKRKEKRVRNRQNWWTEVWFSIFGYAPLLSGKNKHYPIYTKQEDEKEEEEENKNALPNHTICNKASYFYKDNHITTKREKLTTALTLPFNLCRYHIYGKLILILLALYMTALCNNGYIQKYSTVKKLPLQYSTIYSMVILYNFQHEDHWRSSIKKKMEGLSEKISFALCNSINGKCLLNKITDAQSIPDFS